MNKTILNRKLVFYIAMIILSIILLTLGTFYFIRRNNYITNGDKVHAVVENILVHPDANSDTYQADLKEYNELLKEYREAGIIDEHTAVAIIINYDHNGNDITKELGYYSKDIRINQIITLYVNPKDSKDYIMQGKNEFSIYFCFIIGGILLVASAVLLYIDRHNSKFEKQLKEKGIIYEAEVLYADEDGRHKSFDRYPYIFTCVYKDPESKEETYFTSDSIFSRNKGTTYIGQKVKVYVDPEDMTNYYVDPEVFEKR